MKLYEKIINGKQHCKPANKIVIVKNGMQTFNPTEEMLLADGWVEHVPLVYERTIADYIRDKKNEIGWFDSSEEVNIFYIQDLPVWLDKATRAGLKLRFEAEIAMGKLDTVLWYDSMQFPLSLEQAMKMLYAIEVYASACYDNTQYHLSQVDKLETIEEIENYDYKQGYPEKLRF